MKQTLLAENRVIVVAVVVVVLVKEKVQPKPDAWLHQAPQRCKFMAGAGAEAPLPNLK